MAKLQTAAEVATSDDKVNGVEIASVIKDLHSTFSSLDLEIVRENLKMQRATQLEAITQMNHRLEDVVSKDLERRKVPRLLLAELSRESSDEAWESLRIERIKDRRQAPLRKSAFRSSNTN